METMVFKLPPVFLLLCFTALGFPLFSQNSAPEPPERPALSGGTGDGPAGGPSGQEPAEPVQDDRGPGLEIEGPVLAITEPDLETNGPGLETGESETVYYIRDINFDITGRTRPFALIYAGEFKEGERIAGKKNLEAYIEAKTKILHNQRTLEEAGIDFTAGEADEGGLVPVDLLVHVKDTLNLIALPWFEYDSNTGVEVSIKARHYNFLGTMNPLRIDLGYKNETSLVDGSNQGTFFTTIDSDIPFLAWGYRWNLNFDNEFGYVYKEPFYYKNTTGLSVDLPYRSMIFTFGFEQAYILNEETDDEYKLFYGDRFEDTWYMTSEIYTQGRIPTGLKVNYLGELFYLPRLGGKFRYRPGGDMGEPQVDTYIGPVYNPRIGPDISFSQVLTIGTIDWVENLRRGLNLSLTNIEIYNFGTSLWSNSFTAAALGYLPVKPRFGLSARLQYRQWFNGAFANAGDVLRGIKNNWIIADYMVSLNMDFPFLFKQFFVSEMLFADKLSIFNFDMFISPFIDMALINKPIRERGFATLWDRLFITGGLEVIIFPHRMRSSYLRASVGANLVYYFTTHEIPQGHNRELFVGFGHFY